MTMVGKYTRTAMALHWLVAVLIALNLMLIWVVDSVPDAQVRWVIDTHKSIGVTVLGLVLVRLLWRFAHTPPALPASYSQRERRAAHLAHASLYLVMLFLPLSGWLHDSAWRDAATHPMQWFGLLEWPRISWVMNLEPGRKEQWHSALGTLHRLGSYGLYALFTLHVLAVVKHHWVDRESELQRMLP